MYEPDHFDVRDDDQTVAEHTFHYGPCFRNLLVAVDHGNHDGHVARHVEQRLLVCVPLCAVAEDPLIHGCAAHIHHAQPLHNRVVERLAIPAVRLTEKYAH